MDVEAAALYYYICSINYYINVFNYYSKKKNTRKRRWWMIQMHRRRSVKTSEEFIADLMAENSFQFFNFVRMTATDFEVLLTKVGPKITKKDTYFRKAIPAKVRLLVTLRYLATGDSLHSLHFLFKMSTQVISTIIKEVCSALNKALKNLIKVCKIIGLRYIEKKLKSQDTLI